MSAQKFNLLITLLFVSGCTRSCGTGGQLSFGLLGSSTQATEAERPLSELWQKRSLRELGLDASYAAVLSPEEKCHVAALINPKLLPLRDAALQRQNAPGAETTTRTAPASQYAYAVTLCPKAHTIVIFDEERKFALQAAVESSDVVVKDSTGKISQSQEYCSALKILRFHIADAELQNNSALQPALDTSPVFAFKFPTSSSERLYAFRFLLSNETLDVASRELNWIQTPAEISSLRGAHGVSQIYAEFKSQNPKEELVREAGLIYWIPEEGNARVLGISDEGVFIQKTEAKRNNKGLRIVAFPDCINPILDTLYAMQTKD